MTRLPDIHIERAAPDDAPAIQEVTYQGWLSTYPDRDYGVTVGDIEAGFADRHSEAKLGRLRAVLADATGDHGIFVAKRERRIVGFGRAAQKVDRGDLVALYVLPHLKGQGIGAKLWKAIEGWFDRDRPIFTSVAIYNHDAVGFYRHMGFRDTGERLSIFTMIESGTRIEEIRMRLD